MRIRLTLACALAGALVLTVPVWLKAQSGEPPVSADALCSFITGRMQTALPQVPTLCAPVTEAGNDPYAFPDTLIVSVFSPTNVLEGKMRRAWSTALFQTAQALFLHDALNGACERNNPDAPTACELRVSDSTLSQFAFYYRVTSYSLKALKVLGLDGDAASEDYYERWWMLFDQGKTASNPQRMSKDNVEQIAQGACDAFLAKVRQYKATGIEPDFPIPGCSVMLATSTRVYVTVDIPDPLHALLIYLPNWLVSTFGSAFEHTPYDGQVIFRTPWFKDARVYTVYDLSDIEFWWEEERAGDLGRDQAEADARAGFGLIKRRDTDGGVVDRHKLFDSTRFPVRRAAVVRVTPVAGSGFALVDLTDGSEWSVSAESVARCKLTVGEDVTVNGRSMPDGRPRMFLDGCKSSELQATFVQGW